MADDSASEHPAEGGATSPEPHPAKGGATSPAPEAKKSKKTDDKKTGKAGAISEAPKAEKKKKSKRRSIVEGNIYINASFNNTIITVTEPNGSTVSWSSAGASGFKGARKATPYAAQIAAENAIQKAKIYGLERAHVFVKGVGNGREQALRGISINQIDILSITDTTAIPHNGCRKKKARRV